MLNLLQGLLIYAIGFFVGWVCSRVTAPKAKKRKERIRSLVDRRTLKK